MRIKVTAGLGAVLLGTCLSFTCLSFAGATAVAGPATLDCTTKIDGKMASGSCAGTGTFSIVATCTDGSQQTGGVVVIKDGEGTSVTFCSSGVADVRVVTS